MDVSLEIKKIEYGYQNVCGGYLIVKDKLFSKFNYYVIG